MSMKGRDVFSSQSLGYFLLSQSLHFLIHKTGQEFLSQRGGMKNEGDLVFENACKVLGIWPLFLSSNFSLLPTLLSDAEVEPLQIFF